MLKTSSLIYVSYIQVSKSTTFNDILDNSVCGESPLLFPWHCAQSHVHEEMVSQFGLEELNISNVRTTRSLVNHLPNFPKFCWRRSRMSGGRWSRILMSMVWELNGQQSDISAKFRNPHTFHQPLHNPVTDSQNPARQLQHCLHLSSHLGKKSAAFLKI